MNNDDSKEVQKFHFFSSSFLYYHFDEDLLKCLERQKRSDRQDRRFKVKGCNVYKVPVPAGTEYKIEDFRPVVEGTEFIASIVY